TSDERTDMIELARKNLDRVGALDVVELKERDIRQGFDERGVDALFLDVREPWMFLAQAHAALKGGGFFGSLVPTANQLSDLLREMESYDGWTDTEVIEILTREYKPVADRLRPVDRMVAHTGYLLFARAVARAAQATLAEPAAALTVEDASEPAAETAADLGPEQRSEPAAEEGDADGRVESG
ncbi:MAG: tRNA (adenine-N1)-methyltransferase, partial [Chloroflexi bacterium]|nr:tRNA (adenine-N1)-methyltransferase [Chloroflexota bacterium]